MRCRGDHSAIEHSNVREEKVLVSKSTPCIPLHAQHHKGRSDQPHAPSSPSAAAYSSPWHYPRVNYPKPHHPSQQLSVFPLRQHPNPVSTPTLAASTYPSPPPSQTPLPHSSPSSPPPSYEASLTMRRPSYDENNSKGEQSLGMNTSSPAEKTSRSPSLSPAPHLRADVRETKFRGS